METRRRDWLPFATKPGGKLLHCGLVALPSLSCMGSIQRCFLNCASRTGALRLRCSSRQALGQCRWPAVTPSPQFDIPATYPATAPEIELPELEGKTAKMYRGGKICLTIHFKPLWAKNSPHFGIAHALCLGLAPWLAAEVPFLVESGAVKAKS